MPALPPPATGPELYLAAILAELRAMRATIEDPRPPATNTVQLREPAPSPPEPATKRK